MNGFRLECKEKGINERHSEANTLKLLSQIMRTMDDLDRIHIDLVKVPL